MPETIQPLAKQVQLIQEHSDPHLTIAQSLLVQLDSDSDQIQLLLFVINNLTDYFLNY